MQDFSVGNTGLEPVTPALSRQCSEPTELIAPELKKPSQGEGFLWELRGSNPRPSACKAGF